MTRDFDHGNEIDQQLEAKVLDWKTEILGSIDPNQALQAYDDAVAAGVLFYLIVPSDGYGKLNQFKMSLEEGKRQEFGNLSMLMARRASKNGAYARASTFAAAAVSDLIYGPYGT